MRKLKTLQLVISQIICVPILTGLIFMIVGCGVFAPEPRHRELDPSLLPAEYAQLASATNNSDEVTLPRRWWEIFNSRELNTLIETAFTNNLDLATALARLRQSREQMIIAGASGRFTVNGSGSAAVSKDGRTSPFAVDNTWENYGLSLDAAYMLDIWGAVSSDVRAAEFMSCAGAQEVEAIALLISGRIAQAWIQYKTAVMEERLIAEQITTSTQALEILKVRQRAALSAAVDIYQQESQVASLRTLLPQIEEQRSDLRMEINNLLGAPASAPLPVSIDQGTLPEPGELTVVGLPVDLLANRPDVHSAWLDLQAREWSAVARHADRFPSLTLSGALNFEEPEVGDLLKNWHVNLAAGLIGPIVDGGRRVAQLRLAQAQADESFARYTDTVLLALREVEQALARDRTRRAYLAAIENEIALNEKTLSESTNRYRKGLMEYLNVLTALSAKQHSERRALAALSAMLINQVSLYQALGGQVLEGVMHE